MSDEAQPSEVTPDVAPTLDDVINEFHVEPTPTAPVEPKATEPQVPQFAPVDPLNDQQWAAYQQQQMQQSTALQGQLQELNTKLTHMEQERVQAKVEADIKSAVNTVIKDVENADPMMVELYLEKRAAENPGLRQIWDNRDTNPKALEKALKAISGELNDKFSFKADPQIAENHRAALQSQQTGNAAPVSEFNNPLEERLDAARKNGTFEQEWAKIKAGG